MAGMIRPNSALADEFWETGRCASCPVYDMHGHWGAFGPIYFPCVTEEAMLAEMERAGVVRLVFSTHAALMAAQVGNVETVAAVRRHPDRLKGYLAINPNYPALAERELQRFRDCRDVFLGLKFLSDYHRQPLTADGYRPALEFADANRLPVLLHTWGGSSFDGPEQVRAIAAAYPQATFFLGHSFNNHWDEAIAVAKAFPNTYLELTSVLGINGVMELFVGELGSERLLFGTDLPWFAEHQGIGALLSAAISDDDIHNLCHRNAEKLFAAASELRLL